MPNDRPNDIQLGPAGGRLQGFRLWRNRSGGRSWRRYGVANLPGGRRQSDVKYATTPAEIRFSRAYDDFSGGDGFAYRGVAPDNGVHWSENYDTRFSGQAVHVQALRTLNTAVHASAHYDCDGFYDLGWSPDASASGTYLAAPWQCVMALGRSFEMYFQPTGLATEASMIRRQFGNVAPPSPEQRYRLRPATFGSFVYIPRQQEASGLDVSTFIQRGKDNGTTTSVLPAHGFANAGNRLWRYHGPRFSDTNAHFVQSVAAGADPLGTANWSATLIVGDGDRPIKDMVAYRDQVFCGLPDGLYAGDQTGTFFNVTSELANQAHPDNCRDLGVHEGEVVIPHVSGVYAYNPTITDRARVRQVSPAQRSARSPVVGQNRCVRSFAGWLYAGLWTGSQSYLRAGREVAPGDWRWHTLHRLPHVAKIHRLHFDGISQASGGTPVPNRLWVATDMSINTGGTAPIYFSQVPRDNQNPLAADPVFSANYVGSARMDLPADDMDAPGVTKIFDRVEVWADALASGARYIDVYYTMDRGARTLLGRAQAGPVAVLPAGSVNGFFVSGKSVEWSVESFTDSSGTCPVLRALVPYGKMRPQVAEVIEAAVHIADNLVDRSGVPMRPAAVMIDELRALADPARDGGTAARLVDLAGATQYVAVIPPVEEHEIYQQGSDEPEVVASVRMAILSLSAA
jgi:hypothetical protein